MHFSCKINNYGTIYVPKEIGYVRGIVQLRRNQVMVKLYPDEKRGKLMRVYLFSPRLIRIMNYKREEQPSIVFTQRGDRYFGSVSLNEGWREEEKMLEEKFFKKLNSYYWRRNDKQTGDVIHGRKVADGPVDNKPLPSTPNLRGALRRRGLSSDKKKPLPRGDLQ
jgi:hypothetical protein